MAEAYQYSQQYVKSNEQLSNILEFFSSGCVEVDMQLKTLKLVTVNLQSLENYQEAINYLLKTVKLTTEIEEQVNLYQSIANNFLQLGDTTQAIENQVMVYNLVRIIANGGNELTEETLANVENLEDGEETEQTIQALFNIVQIKFMVLQSQVQQANESQDTEAIDTDFLLDTKENLEVLSLRMQKFYG